MEPSLTNKSSEFVALQAILPLLLEKGLITEKDKDEITNTKTLTERKLAFYDLIVSKRFNPSKDILKFMQHIYQKVFKDVLSSDTEDSDTTEDEDDPITLSPIRSEQKNPLLNNVIIKNLFGYLSLDDIKSLRLVCKEWNSVAEPLLRKRAKIDFHQLHEPSEFFSTFNNSLENLPFTAFKFTGRQNMSKLEQFFSSWGEYVTYLELDCIELSETKITTLRIDNVMLVSVIDITPLLDESILTDLIITASSTPRFTAQLGVQIGKVTTVKNFNLKGCMLFWNPNDVKVSPSKITLDNVRFLMDNNNSEPEEYLLNNAFDFSNATEINITPLLNTRLILDVGKESVAAQQVTLKSVEVTNWENSKWSVNTLKLDSISVDCKTAMQIKELKIVNTTTIDLSHIPPTLEKLHLNLSNNTGVSCTQPANLPNLQCVEIILQKSVRGLTLLSFLSSCSKLREISIKKRHNRISTLDLNWIPRSVQKMKMNNSIAVVDRSGNFADNPFALESIILDRYNFTETAKLLKIMQPELLVMRWNSYPYPNKSSWSTAENMAELVAANPGVQKIVMNFTQIPNIPSVEFTKSALSNYVDKKANFYLFEDQKGNELTKEEFEVYMNI